jgi:two-component system response regulator AtoC
MTDYVLLGNHPSMEKIRELISMVSDTAFNVLILGETGTGKEVVARLLHQTSSRRNGSFIKVNCGALPVNLLESELFGYEKGAFTGATDFKPGKFELARDGVLFLDEIGDMPQVLQAKLLHVLQSGEFTRLGGTKDVTVNSWIISATNHDLEEDMRTAQFRKDLFYRLNIIKIEIPPLRERRQDVPLLIRYLSEKHAADMGIKERFRLDPKLKRLMLAYHWPGNVRELSSMILRMMVGEDPQAVRLELLDNMQAEGLPIAAKLDERPSESRKRPQDMGGSLDPSVRPLKDLAAEATKYIERKAILHALNMANWNKRKAAKQLRISYKALFYKMDDLGIAKGGKSLS